MFIIDKKLPCFEFQETENIINAFRQRLSENKTDKDILNTFESLFSQSCNNFWTNKYDYFQYYTNNVYY